MRLAVLALAGLAAGAVTGVAVIPQARERLLPGASVRVWGQAQIGGPFALTDHTGKQVTDADFRGRIMLVVFGCVSCPDMGPGMGAPTLQVLSAALARLGPGAERLVPVFITVDPVRDTPDRLKPYVESFHPRLVGLTGTRAEIEDVLKAYRVRVPLEGDPSWTGQRADHPALVYVIGADGRYRTHLSYRPASMPSYPSCAKCCS